LTPSERLTRIVLLVWRSRRRTFCTLGFKPEANPSASDVNTTYRSSELIAPGVVLWLSKACGTEPLPFGLLISKVDPAGAELADAGSTRAKLSSTATVPPRSTRAVSHGNRPRSM
jgi:hypothetical protein